MAIVALLITQDKRVGVTSLSYIASSHNTCIYINRVLYVYISITIHAFLFHIFSYIYILAAAGVNNYNFCSIK